MSKTDDPFAPEEGSVLPDNRDTFRPPQEPSPPPLLPVVMVVLGLAIALIGGIAVGRATTREHGTWRDRALAAVREAVESGCGDVQVYGGTITGPQAAKRMDAAIASVEQLARLQGYAVFQADSWSQGPEEAGGAVVVAKC